MGRIIRLAHDRHAEACMLLPWYLTGQLDEGERAALEAHLRHCADCQAELRQEERLDLAVGALQLDVEHGWSKMRRRLSRPETWSSRLMAALKPAFSSGGIGGAALAGQFALVLAATVAVITLSPPAYRTLGSPTQAPSGNVVVVFRPETPEAQLRAILTEGDARMVDGPTSAGAYVLAVRPATRAASLAALRRHPQVLMAEPVDTDLGP